MAREYRVNEYYLQFHELQPASTMYYPYDMQSNASVPSSYQLTTGLEGIQPCDAVSMISPQHIHHTNLSPRKRKSTYSDGYDASSIDMPLSQASTSMQEPTSSSRKRKSSIYAGSSAYEDDASEDARSSRTIPDKKQNHSEIEKRRRDKMNTYISELSAIVPMCGAIARKLDKLTVLRMAVQHLRSIRGALSAGPLTARPRPSFLSERELNSLVLQAARDCFLMVVGCDRGRLLYVSASVTKLLHYDQSELLGQSLFDILHPKDVAKVKEQLSSSDLSPRERLIDAKTMLPVKADVVMGASRLCPGARRSFFCRIKTRMLAARKNNQNMNDLKDESYTNCKLNKKQANEKKYCVVQCTGYLKSWGPAEMSEFGVGSADANLDDGDACNMSCLVAVGRALTDLEPQISPAVYTRHLQYISRHATDGKFLFVDQRVTLALGFLPQELLGASLYEYVNTTELAIVARTHKAALLRKEALMTPPYCFRRKDNSFVRMQTHFKPFKNPWTKDVECLVANNTVLTEDQDHMPYDDCEDYEMFKQSEPIPEHQNATIPEADGEIQRLIETQVGSHKIGSTIAEEALRRSSTDFSPDLSADLLHDVVFNQQTPLADNILGEDFSNYDTHVRNNVPLSSAGLENSPPSESNGLSSGSTPCTSPPLPSLSLDGNGEAAMAVIMSLLEADAGLGGPVNFSGLPWPLP